MCCPKKCDSVGCTTSGKMLQVNGSKIVAGMDIRSLSASVVIMKNSETIGSTTILAVPDRVRTVQQIIDRALGQCGLKINEIQSSFLLAMGVVISLLPRGISLRAYVVAEAIPIFFRTCVPFWICRDSIVSS